MKSEIAFVTALAAFILGCVGMWAGFNAKSQVEKDRVDLEALIDSEHDFLETTMDRVLDLEQRRVAGHVSADGTATDLAPDYEALRQAIAASSQRHNRMAEEHEQLRKKVNDMIGVMESHKKGLDRHEDLFTELKRIIDSIPRQPTGPGPKIEGPGGDDGDEKNSLGSDK